MHHIFKLWTSLSMTGQSTGDRDGFGSLYTLYRCTLNHEPNHPCLYQVLQTLYRCTQVIPSLNRYLRIQKWLDDSEAWTKRGPRGPWKVQLSSSVWLGRNARPNTLPWNRTRLWRGVSYTPRVPGIGYGWLWHSCKRSCQRWPWNIRNT